MNAAPVNASGKIPVVLTFPASGQQHCYDNVGMEIDCHGSGQDAEFHSGLAWPRQRFELRDDGQVRDHLTGLIWPANANPAEYPLTWSEALAAVMQLNRDQYLGANDWRLPNRRELRSLVSHQTARPALPSGHPFSNVFPGWYWSSTSYAGNPAHAWYVHMDGGRMFYGGKDQAFLLWPVRGEGNGLLARTGQTRCFHAIGDEMECAGSLQDGASRCGRHWPQPRFIRNSHGVLDQLTGLLWRAQADLTKQAVSWDEALATIHTLNQSDTTLRWRLPNILELESLTDCSRAQPALSAAAPFSEVRTAYWSSTTSAYETDWAWVLYLDKGAVGVGQKSGRYFHVWPVTQQQIK
jgi:hypothetical protein